VHFVGCRSLQLRHQSFVYLALPNVFGGGVDACVCCRAERGGITHTGTFYGLNIFRVEVSVMIQTQNRIAYATHRVYNTASLAVMQKHGICFIHNYL
jgi:hypothetical protein